MFKTSHKVPLKGLFQEGVWHCNCQPRLPASNFLVRKEGPTKGRWFYTCQKPKDQGCGFFLWAEDAAPREMKAVINNSRSEIAPIAKTTNASGSTTVNELPFQEHTGVAPRRKDVEGFGEWPLSVEDEAEVVEIVEKASGRTPHPETPRKTVKHIDLRTPGSKRKRDNPGETWPTPVTGGLSASRNKDIFTAPATRLKGGMFDGNEKHATLLSPSITPTPNRFRDGNDKNGLGDLASDLGEYEITQEVLAFLSSQSIDDETTTKVTEVLNRHALKTQGIIRGRDITRVALKAKDVKIAELQQRISALETEREMDKVVIKHFKSDIADSIARGAKVGGRRRGS